MTHVRSDSEAKWQDEQAGHCLTADCEMAASIGLQADPLRLIAEANKQALGLDQVRKPPAVLTSSRP